MLLVLYWDHSSLGANNTAYGYILVKGVTILSLLGMALYFYLNDREVTWQQEAYGALFFVYSYYGMVYIDMTYSFSFIEAFIVLSIGLRTSKLRYIVLNSAGLVCMLLGHYYAQEPVFVASGQSYKPHSLTINFILFVAANFMHFLIIRQQDIINKLNGKFALIGKQSSFLIHEIKNPLNRVVTNSEISLTEEIMSDIRRDSQKISALVNSMEVLIHDPERLSHTFTGFDWSELAENLSLDFNTYMTSMNIRFNFTGFEGPFHGSKPLLYQLLRNHILNAIEAIGFRKDGGSEITISYYRKGGKLIINVSNTNSSIQKRDFDRIFAPHFTTKKNETNKGLGLALSKSIVEAHKGKISVTSEANKTDFWIELPTI